MNKNDNTKEQATSTSGKPVYIVTGATGAMGKVIAKRIASQGKPVILACRDLDKGKKLANELKTVTLNNDITAMQ
jgi:NADP-dependent 3-hydroxy acid dehydrogenase YdfG